MIQGESVSLGVGRMPIQVPVPVPAVHYFPSEHAASTQLPARGGSIEVDGVETVKGLQEILEENRRRTARPRRVGQRGLWRTVLLCGDILSENMHIFYDLA